MINTKTFAKQLQEGLTKIVESKVSAEKAEDIVTLVFAELEKNMVEGEKTRINKFGDFDHVQRNARKGRNPQTGKEIQIEAKKAPRFTPAKGLKDSVKG